MLRHTVYGNPRNLTLKSFIGYCVNFSKCRLGCSVTRNIVAHIVISAIEPYLSILSLKLGLETYPEGGAFPTITLVQHP